MNAGKVEKLKKLLPAMKEEVRKALKNMDVFVLTTFAGSKGLDFQSIYSAS